MDRTSTLEYLIFLLLCSSISCLCETCQPLGDSQRCILKTSQPDEWFSGLNSKQHKVQVLLVFDSVEAPQNIPLETIDLGILVVNVSVENTKVCDEGAASSSSSPPPTTSPSSLSSSSFGNLERGDCLSKENIIETINKVLKLFQNRVIFFSLHLKSDHILQYTPLSGIKMLTDLVTSGFRMKFVEPLARMSRDLVSVTFEKAGIAGLDEIDFKGCQKYLEVLKLNHNHLKDLSPSQLPVELKKLKTLELQFNEITGINRNNFLTNLKKLVSLHLHGNRISFVDEFAFSGLKDLIYLSLGDNRLVAVPAINSIDGSHLNLEELILRQNDITVFDNEVFKNLPRLLYLDLRFTCIGAFDLSNLENLKSLKLSHGCTKTFKFKQDKSSLKSFYVNDNRFEKFDGNFLSIMNNSNLVFEADFSNNPWLDCDAFIEWHDTRCNKEITDRYECRVGGRNLTVKFINHESFECIRHLDVKVPAVSKAAALHFVCLSRRTAHFFVVVTVCSVSIVLRFLE